MRHALVAYESYLPSKKPSKRAKKNVSETEDEDEEEEEPNRSRKPSSSKSQVSNCWSLSGNTDNVHLIQRNRSNRRNMSPRPIAIIIRTRNKKRERSPRALENPLQRSSLLRNDKIRRNRKQRTVKAATMTTTTTTTMRLMAQTTGMD